MAYNPDTDQWLVVWQDQRTDSDIYGRRISGDGSLDGGEYIISSSGVDILKHPSVTYNPVSGEYFVVFTHESLTNNGNIRGRRVPASGTPSTPGFTIATGPTTQNYPDVDCRTTVGGYLVVWRELDTQLDIKGQRVNQTGTLLDGVLDICTDGSAQWSPHVAYSADVNRYLVVWADDRDSATQGRNIYGRQVTGVGALQTEIPISTAAEDQAHVTVAYAEGLGNYVVVWDDDRNMATSPDIYGQLVDGSGTLVDTTASTNELLFEYSGAQEFPALAWGDSSKKGLVVWQDKRNGASFDIYGLRLADYYTVYLPLVLRGAGG